MKHIIILAFILSAGYAHAQKAFQGGVLFGPVTSQISGDGLGGWDKFGFTAGAWVNMPLSEKAGVGISMKYITKGSRTKQDTLTYQSFGYYLNYVDVPILFTYKKPLKKSSLTLSIGPYAGYLLNQKIKANGANQDVFPVPYKKYDIGGQAGVAYWAGEKMFFEFNISSSILPTRPNPSFVNKLSHYERGNYNQVLQLLIGLRFGGSTTKGE
jgi:hypothetical protein